MVPTAVLLALASSVCWAGLDAIRKRLVQTVEPVPLVVLLLVGQLPFFLLWAVRDGQWVSHGDYVLPAVGTVLMNAGANVLFVKAVQVSPLSRTIPFLSLTPAFSALIAMPLLGEFPNAWQWLGIAAVVVGAFVLNLDKGSSVLSALTEEKGSVMMVAVGALWAASTALDKVALQHASAATHSLVLSGGSAAVLITWLVLRSELGSLTKIRVSPGHLALLFGFAVGSLAFQMVAIKTLWVAIVETIKRAVGVIAAVVLGKWMFQESVTQTKVIASGLMIVGTALLTWGDGLWRWWFWLWL